VVTPSDYGAPSGPRYPALVEERYEFELAQSARVLDNVDRALERLSEGAYGSCATCGAPILGADLAADPTRRLCEQHLALGQAGDPGYPGDPGDAEVTPAG
jgi:hypothetical protein